jgi:hypothetical protein
MKARRVLLAVCLGIVLALTVAELGLRFLVHHPSVSLGEFGKHLRLPENFSDGNSEDDYWTFLHTVQDPALRGPAENPDPVVGWTGHYVRPGTYEQIDAPSIRGRTPILLYGDSFAQCNTPPYECFQSILERSDLADRYCLLNYGVGGYGLDQTYLLLENSIDRYASLDPIVIVSVLVESDLDRCVLSFRCWPKPRLDVVEGELKARGPVLSDPDEWVRQHPITFRSFLWRYLIYKPMPGLRGWQERLQGEHRRIPEKRMLNFEILRAIQRDLEERHLRYFVLLFHIEQAALAQSPGSEWQEPLMRDASRTLSMPLVDTRPYFQAASRRLSGGVARFYGQGPPLFGHLNALGNLVAFEAIRQGLAGRFDAEDTAHLESWIEMYADESSAAPDPLASPEMKVSPFAVIGREAAWYAQGGRDWVRSGGSAPPDGADEDQEDGLSVHAGPWIPTEVRFDLEPGLKRFTAQVSAVESTGAHCAGAEVELDVRVDGVSAWRGKIRRGAEPVSIAVDIDRHQSLALVVSGQGVSDDCAWIRVARPRIE